MIDPTLENYLIQAKQRGLSDDLIRQELQKAGWSVDQINQALSPNGSEFKPPSPPPQHIPSAAYPSNMPMMNNKGLLLSFAVLLVALASAAASAYFFFGKGNSLSLQNTVDQKSTTEQNNLELPSTSQPTSFSAPSTATCKDDDIDCLINLINILIDKSVTCTPIRQIYKVFGISTRYEILGFSGTQCQFQDEVLGGTFHLDQAYRDRAKSSGASDADIQAFTQGMQEGFDMSVGKVLKCNSPTSKLTSYLKEVKQGTKNFHEKGEVSFSTDSVSFAFTQDYCNFQ